MIAVVLITSCRPTEQPSVSRFTTLSADQTGITFSNNLEYTEDFNVYTYRNFYNGGGVALGDINNDGMIDIYFSGNLVENKLYLNLDSLRFKDITDQAQVASKGSWSTGVSMVDVNGDGWLDIYVCKSGKPGGENRHNELFINNGDLTFTERAEEYGIAEVGLSVHGAFFDFDRDGDLDLYLLNNSIRSIGGYDLRPGQREIPDPDGGNKLFENIGQGFREVTDEAGIYSSNIGFGLGVTITDFDRDGWPDMFVSNDFFERDYLYRNNGDGTFSEVLEEHMREISMSSMGADVADINHDGFPEIFVTDMLPEGEARMKTATNFHDWYRYWTGVENGYHHQFVRNVLHLNNGDGSFSEIGRLAGVCATDWSWGALFADLDNNGSQDIFVSNGIYKDLTDQDYINFTADEEVLKAKLRNGEYFIKELVDAMPSHRISNYAFSGVGELSFENKAAEWGLNNPSYSNGSAYGDLDNDGDLDLVVNNTNMEPFIYRNNTVNHKGESNNYLIIELKGTESNTSGIGTQVTLWKSGKIYFKEQNPFRGFQSTVDPRLHFGLGDVFVLDSLKAAWPDGRVNVLYNVEVNQTLEIDQTKSEDILPAKPGRSKVDTIFSEDKTRVSHQHVENEFVDFDRDRLIHQMISSEGPKICVADVNGDQLLDMFIGGAKGTPGALLIQNADGWTTSKKENFEKDKGAEDLGCAFLDVNNDGAIDLYVNSGGNEFSSTSTGLADRLYLGRGDGEFQKSNGLLPDNDYLSTSVVVPSDFDQDGDVDLFVGERLKPFKYGFPGSGFLLENNGSEGFLDVTETLAPQLKDIGMITGASWQDIDNDGDIDLIIIGDWMPVKVFTNEEGKFSDFSIQAGFGKTNGLWSALGVGDFNKDGYPDLVLGNHGNNTRLKASVDRPLTMYIDDFDKNGSVEQIITMYNGPEAYPLALRHDIIKQIPSLQRQYPRYADYKEQTIADIFNKEQLVEAEILKVYTTHSQIALNNGDGTFSLTTLPTEAQFSPIYALLIDDFNGDGMSDILLGGNFYRSKPQIGIYDASYGLLLEGKGGSEFSVVSANESGFFVKGEIRDLKKLTIGGQKAVIVARNNDYVKVFTY